MPATDVESTRPGDDAGEATEEAADGTDDATDGGEPLPPPGGGARSLVSARIARYAVLGPILLVSAQVLINYFFLQLPSALVAKMGRDPAAYHRYLTSRGAFSDLYTLYWHSKLYLHPVPYVNVQIGYPVVLGMYMTAAAALTHGVRTYFALSSLGLWVCAVGSVCCLWSLSKKSAWIFSACPMLLVFSLLNWDLLAIVFMLLGWHAWTRDRPVQAALWLTLGTFTKLYPIFLLTFCGVELVRRWRFGQIALGVVVRYLAAACALALALNLPFVILAPSNWASFFTYNSERNQHVSIVYWLHILSATTLRPQRTMSSRRSSGWRSLPACTPCGGAGQRQGVSAVVFAVFLVMQKVYSPQYTLWLVPFGLLAEWEFWSICVVSMVGLGNYISAATSIYLRGHDPRLADWFARTIQPLERDTRLACIVVVTAASALGPAVRRRLDKQKEGGELQSASAPLPVVES